MNAPEVRFYLLRITEVSLGYAPAYDSENA